MDGKPAVVAAVQRAGGGGQVMVLTVDSTWLLEPAAARYSARPTRSTVDSGVRRSVGWPAAAATNNRPLLTVSTDKPYYEVGQRVKIRLVRQSRADVDVSEAQAVAGDHRAGRQAVAAGADARAGRRLRPAGRFRRRVHAVAGGRYEVNAALKADGKALANQTAEFFAQGPDSELADQGTNSAT